MAEVNSELAELVMEMLNTLKVPESVTYTNDGRSIQPVDARVDAYGAAFQRLYALVAGSPATTPQVQEAIEKLDAISAPQPGS